MRPARSCLLVAVCSIANFAAVAADVVNGWSGQTAISGVYCLSTSTMFRLAGVSDGCGHADFWVLPLEETAKAKAKLSILLSAHATGKKVSLRCENSSVTDFQVVE